MKKFIRFLLIIILVISLTIVYARYGGTRGLITKEYKIETIWKQYKFLITITSGN